jgi:[2Fe-2S] binding domain
MSRPRTPDTHVVEPIAPRQTRVQTSSDFLVSREHGLDLAEPVASVQHDGRRTHDVRGAAAGGSAGQRYRASGHDRTACVAARRSSRPFAIDRHEEGVRPGSMRRMHGPGGRRADQLLPDACRQLRRRDIQTIEGLSHDGKLHPLQRAFIVHDGFQCGYCTPGQICSAVAMLAEFKRGMPSALSGSRIPHQLNEEELRERMSGNLCRCGAYVGIRQAIQDVAGGMAG